jgi:hypothetical protein
MPPHGTLFFRLQFQDRNPFPRLQCLPPFLSGSRPRVHCLLSVSRARVCARFSHALHGSGHVMHGVLVVPLAFSIFAPAYTNQLSMSETGESIVGLKCLCVCMCVCVFVCVPHLRILAGDSGSAGGAEFMLASRIPGAADDRWPSKIFFFSLLASEKAMAVFSRSLSSRRALARSYAKIPVYYHEWRHHMIVSWQRRPSHLPHQRFRFPCHCGHLQSTPIGTR